MDPPPRLIGQRILRFATVDSTNRVAAEHASDRANDGLVILADHQSAGRGRLGRTWTSPARDNVLMSVLLFPQEHLRRPVLLTVLAAAAVCETIHVLTDLEATIKWPNDVLIRGKKVCGILVEQGQAVVIGIGLNVNVPPTALAEAGLDQAASLSAFTGMPLDRDRVSDVLIQRLDEHYAALRAGQVERLRAAWRSYSGLVDQNIVIKTFAGSIDGRLLDLDFDQVTVRLADGQVRGFAPETIEHLQLN